MSAQPDPRDPLNRVLRAHKLTDAEMRVILRDAAREAEQIVLSYGDSFSASVRRAQLDIARSQMTMWHKVGDLTHIAIGDGADAASESVARLMSVYMNSLGYTTEGMRYALLAQGRAGIANLISRTANGIPLSQQVYRTSVLSNGQLQRTINALVANGASAREIATRVRQFVDPRTPGGASYAAMRLGRTELNNAFHTTSISHYQANPFVDGVKWSLSRSHPKADKCDEYANSSHFRGGPPGVYKPNDVPPKPHPQCFCFLAPTVVDDDQFVREFKAGKYNAYQDGELGGTW